MLNNLNVHFLTSLLTHCYQLYWRRSSQNQQEDPKLEEIIYILIELEIPVASSEDTITYRSSVYLCQGTHQCWPYSIRTKGYYYKKSYNYDLYLDVIDKFLAQRLSKS